MGNFGKAMNKLLVEFFVDVCKKKKGLKLLDELIRYIIRYNCIQMVSGSKNSLKIVAA